MSCHATQSEILEAERRITRDNAAAVGLAAHGAAGIRASVCRPLARLASSRSDAQEALLRLLRDTDENVRYAAALAVAAERGALPATELTNLLDDDSPRVRRQAAEALADADGPAVSDALRLTAEKDSDEPTAVVAARAIERNTPLLADSVLRQTADRFAREVIGRLAPCPFLDGQPPAANDWDAEWPDDGGIAGAFMRCGALENQGNFTFTGAQTAWPQTTAYVVVWERALGVAVVADETDNNYQPRAGKDGSPASGDHIGISVALPGQAPARLLVSAEGLVDSTPGPLPADVAVRVSERGYEVRTVISLPEPVRPGERFGFNVFRRTSSSATGWGDEFSSWSYAVRLSDTPDGMGELAIVDTPVWLELSPKSSPGWAPEIDRFSTRLEHRQLLSSPGTGKLPQVPPLYLSPGENEMRLAIESEMPMNVFAGALSTAKHATFVQHSLQPGAHELSIRLNIDDEQATCREWMLIFELTDARSGDRIARCLLDRIPLVEPPVNETLRCSPERIDGRKSVPGHRRRTPSPSFEDLGPIPHGESYPMGLVCSESGVVYGGTYPSGRLFAYDIESDMLYELGNACEPHNHLESIVVAENEMVYLGYVRPEGKLGCFDPRSRISEDLGPPVPGAIGGDCHVSIALGETIWGYQRGGLWCYHWKTDAFSAAGPVQTGDGQFAPVWDVLPHRRESGAALVLSAGGLVAWAYVIGRTVVRYALTDVPITGKLFERHGDAPCLIQADGSVLRLDAQERTIEDVWTTDGSGINPAVVLVRGLDDTLYRVDQGETRPAIVYAHRPGQSRSQALGSPPGDPEWIPAVACAVDGTIYGVSARNVYGIGRCTGRLWRLRPGRE